MCNFSAYPGPEGLPSSSLHFALYEFYDTLPSSAEMPSAVKLQLD